MTLEEKLSELKAKAEKAKHPQQVWIEGYNEGLGNAPRSGGGNPYRDDGNEVIIHPAVILALVEVAMRCHRLNSVLDSALQDGDTVICRGPAMRDVDAALASLDAALGEVGGE